MLNKPKNGDVVNGVFFLNGDTWLILDQSVPLEQFLKKQIIEQHEYIKKLTERTNDLEKWLLENGK